MTKFLLISQGACGKLMELLTNQILFKS